MSREKDYNAGDLIWAKMRGFPHWPARVDSVNAPPQPGEVAPRGKYAVFFFGTHEVAHMGADSIHPYEENKEKYAKPRKSKRFNQGLKEIVHNPNVCKEEGTSIECSMVEDVTELSIRDEETEIKHPTAEDVLELSSLVCQRITERDTETNKKSKASKFDELTKCYIDEILSDDILPHLLGKTFHCAYKQLKCDIQEAIAIETAPIHTRFSAIDNMLSKQSSFLESFQEKKKQLAERDTVLNEYSTLLNELKDSTSSYMSRYSEIDAVIKKQLPELNKLSDEVRKESEVISAILHSNSTAISYDDDSPTE